MITASTSMKLPNVSWPIESENDRGGSEFGGNSAVMWLGPGSCRHNIRRISAPWGTCRTTDGMGKIARPHRQDSGPGGRSADEIPLWNRITRQSADAVLNRR